MEGRLALSLSIMKPKSKSPPVDSDLYVQALHTGDYNWMRKGKKEWLDKRSPSTK